jgi:hypothetical protein
LPRRTIGKEQIVESINQLKAARSCDYRFKTRF